LHENGRRIGLPFMTFRPKKGDTLTWAAELVHGGATVIDWSTMRRSQIGRDCPIGVSTNYFSYRPDRRIHGPPAPGWTSSEYYDLSERSFPEPLPGRRNLG
jgi:hypothetical protein